MATATLITTNVTILDDADANTQWGADRSLVGPDTELYKEATASMGCTIQAAHNADEIWITKTSGTWDLSNTHIRLWIFFTAVGQLDTDANGGIQIGVGDGSNTGWWNVSGSDTYKGGWKLLQIDTRLAVDSGTKPTMTAITTVRLKVVLTTSPKNATNLWTDFWHAYEDPYEVYGGTSGDPITWSEIASADEASGLGVIQEVDGVYFFTGPVEIGASGQTTYFEITSETAVFVDNFVNTGYYLIDFTGDNTHVNIEGGSIQAIADRFDFFMDDDSITGSYVTLNGISFLYASGSYFKSGAVVKNCKWVDCFQVEPSGSAFFDNTFVNSQDPTGALLFPPDDSTISGLTFINCEAGIHYDSNSDASSPTFNRITFDDVTDKYDVFNSKGSSVTIACTDCNANSYHPSGSTVTFDNTVSVDVNAVDTSNEGVSGARVFIYNTGGTALSSGYTDAAGDFTYNHTYAGDLDILINLRRSSDTPKYKPQTNPGVIESIGFSGKYTMIADDIADTGA